MVHGDTAAVALSERRLVANRRLVAPPKEVENQHVCRPRWDGPIQHSILHLWMQASTSKSEFELDLLALEMR
jgi:hypothetical protein